MGPETDRYILEVCQKVEQVVVAWGVHGEIQQRALAVLGLLDNIPLWCLGTTKGGYPRHPLYLPRDVQRQVYA